MCGRYGFTKSSEEYVEWFDVNALIGDFEGSTEVFPTSDVWTIIDRNGERAMGQMRWGLIPGWAKDASIGSKMFNARSETAYEKPSFKNALRQRRCLVIADGYYEWQKLEKGKQKYWVTSENGKPMAFAGLWEKWVDPATQSPVFSCTILTGEPHDDRMLEIHHRVPLIITRENWTAWLDREKINLETIHQLWSQPTMDTMRAIPQD